MIECKVGTYQLLLKGKEISYKELGIERWKKMAETLSSYHYR